MAKMFYTLEEVCQKLGKTEDEITAMVRSGQIQEFRDRDRLMFKVDQIDLLAGGEDDASEVHLELEDTSGGSGLALQSESSAELGLADSREETGISVFDTDHGGAAASDGEGTEAGAAAADAGEEEELTLDAIGSGSGLLDLTRESEETSLGAELLEEVYSTDENVEIPAHASGLFEAAGLEKTDEPVAASVGGAASPGIGAMPMVLETYDGTGSGFGAGMLIGALAALVCVGIMTVVAVSGATPDLVLKFGSSSGSMWIWAGGFLGVTLILGLVGLFIGKASE